MQPQGGTIWGNINLCIEIALNIYYLLGEKGEGIAIEKDHANRHFSSDTVEAGKEEEGYLYYPQEETMDQVLEEMGEMAASGLEFTKRQMEGESVWEEEYGEQVDFGFER